MVTPSESTSMPPLPMSVCSARSRSVGAGMPASGTTSVGADGTTGGQGIESFAPMPDSRQRFRRAGGFPSYHSAVQVGVGRLRWGIRAHRHRARLPVVALRHRGLLRADVFLAAYPKSGNTWLAF